MPPPIGSVGRFTRLYRNRFLYPAPRVSPPIAITRFHSGAIIGEYSRRLVRERTGVVFLRPRRYGRPDRAGCISGPASISSANRILSPVTIADRAIEQELRRLISIRFPEHGILGEETGSTPGIAIPGISTRSTGPRASFPECRCSDLDCARRRKEGAVIAGHDRYAGAGGAMVRHPERHDVQRGTGQSQPAVNLADAQIYTSSPDFFSPEDWAALRRAQPQGDVPALWRRLLSIRAAGVGLLRSCGGIVAEVLRLHGTGAGRRRRRRRDVRLGRPAAHPRFRRTGDRRRQRSPARAGAGGPRQSAETLWPRGSAITPSAASFPSGDRTSGCAPACTSTRRISDSRSPSP